MKDKPKQSRKARLNPSKLLVLLLYGTYPYMKVEEVEEGLKEVTLEIGPFARLLRVKNAHIIEYVEWLEEMNFLSIIAKNKGSLTVALETPTLFRDVG